MLTASLARSWKEPMPALHRAYDLRPAHCRAGCMHLLGKGDLPQATASKTAITVMAAEHLLPWLQPFGLIDSDSQTVLAAVAEATHGCTSEEQKAVACYHYVRDRILFGFSPGFGEFDPVWHNWVPGSSRSTTRSANVKLPAVRLQPHASHAHSVFSSSVAQVAQQTKTRPGCRHTVNLDMSMSLQLHPFPSSQTSCPHPRCCQLGEASAIPSQHCLWLCFVQQASPHGRWGISADNSV